MTKRAANIKEKEENMAGRRKEKREKTQKTKSRKQNLGKINGEKKERIRKQRSMEQSCGSGSAFIFPPGSGSKREKLENKRKK